MAEFFHMGGYAAFVWGSYGAVLFVLVLIVFTSIRRHSGALKDVMRRAKHEYKKQS